MKQNSLSNLESILNYQFKDQQLLQTALTHRSCLNTPDAPESYERLEFLGDAILEMMISVYLYKQYPTKMEGYLTAARSAIVRTESLSMICEKYHFSQFIKMSKGEESTGGRKNPSILEDIIESIIGAIYLDGGNDGAQSFFDQFILPNTTQIDSEKQLKDPKSLLQEKVQAQGLASPIYKTIGETGPDHSKIFEVEVMVNNVSMGTGTGKNKQEAEQMAAKNALENQNYLNE